MSESFHCVNREKPTANFVDIGIERQAPSKHRLVGGFPVASFPRRLLASISDFLISLSAAVLILATLVLPPANKPPPGSPWDAYIKHDTFRTSAIVALVISFIIYPILSNWLFKGSAGKRLLHLQIVDHNGRHVGMSWILIRHAALTLTTAILPLAIARIALDRDSQGWHDKIARTYVSYAGGGRFSTRRETQHPDMTGKARLRSDDATD